jgi:hypothetical protein
MAVLKSTNSGRSNKEPTMTMTRDKIEELKRTAQNAWPGPWAMNPEPFDNDGTPETIVSAMDGKAAICVTMDWGKNNPLMREANALHIAACDPQTILSLLALAERALEPQGQALPVATYGGMMGQNGYIIFSPPWTSDQPIPLKQGDKLYAEAPADPPEWQDMSTAAWSDDLIWLRRGNEVDGPRPIVHDDYDRYSHWAPCEAPSIYASQLALPAGPVPEGDVESKVRALLWNDYPICCGNFQSGEWHMGMREPDQCCGSPDRDMLGDADIVKALREMFPETSSAASPAVAQPVADERAEYELMLRAGYQHDNVRRQERGLASTDELTEGQEREIAERVALKFPSGAGLRKDSPVAFSCARRAAHPTSWTMTCDKHCGDDAKCFRAALCQPAEEGDKA